MTHDLTTNTPPPRVKYNAELAEAWLEKNRIKDHDPTIEQQVEIFKIDRQNLSGFGYNPSIIRHDNRLLMAYRWHKTRSPATVISIAELGAKGNIVSNSEVEIGDSSIEDPRLFLRGEELWMAWIQSTWPTRPPTCVVMYGRLTYNRGWKVDQASKPEYGENNGSAMEKNWVPWARGRDLCAIYSSFPEQTVIQLDREKVVEEWKTPGPCWPWGLVKGGTTPMPYRGKLMRFFHSTLDNEPPPWRRRYYTGAMVMEPEPPFEVLDISTKPIIQGSPNCEVKPHEAAFYKGNVVFPAGCIQSNFGKWLVSIGVNDCLSAIAVIGNLNLSK